MEARVLVVDAGLQPVNIIPWKRAFIMLNAEKRRGLKKPTVLVYSFDGSVVGAEHKQRLPSVIQLGHMVPRFRRRARFCRQNVIIGRDRGVCQYCGEQFMTEDLSLDHIVPRAQGGITTWENTVACCIPCNQKKANRTPEQAHMKLLRKPARPTQLLDVSVRMDVTNVPREWHDYWFVTLQP